MSDKDVDVMATNSLRRSSYSGDKSVDMNERQGTRQKEKQTYEDERGEKREKRKIERRVILSADDDSLRFNDRTEKTGSPLRWDDHVERRSELEQRERETEMEMEMVRDIQVNGKEVERASSKRGKGAEVGQRSVKFKKGWGIKRRQGRVSSPGQLRVSREKATILLSLMNLRK